MTFFQTRTPFRFRAIGVCLLASFVFMTLSPLALLAQSEKERIYETFEKVSALRSQGQFDQAIEILKGIITEYAKSDEVLKRAYDQLVYTFWSKQDLDSATASAREALSRFPDISADPLSVSSKVNEIYDTLRAEMYGSLVVITKPEGCRVILGGDLKGSSPVRIPYVKVGEYTLNVSKSGYKDELATVRVAPASPTTMQLSLQKDRNKKWWLLRVGPVALVAGALTVLGLQGEETSGAQTPTPLPGPPDPPSD
jgi:hypothetical protein